jgi:hypothetical protein
MSRKTIRLPARGGMETLVAREVDEDPPSESHHPIPPADWQLGQLLNVRNNGADYIVTLMPEEYDYRHPERALTFTNQAQCQNFVSAWYARTFDPAESNG